MSTDPTTVVAIRPLLSGALVTLPALILGIIFVLGLVLEVSGGSQFAASDAINWLPVSAGEFVIGSVLTFAIYYSVVPVLFISATLPLAYIFGMIRSWELGTVLSVFAIFIGASVLEIIRAVLNRFSSSFYKKGGRGAIATRAIFYVLLILVFQVMFYPTFYTRIIGDITSNLGPAWFIPILWSSVSVSALQGGNGLVSASFALLFVSLTGGLFFGAIFTRTRYWVPMPASIRISTSAYSPRGSSPLVGILSPSQLAITRKDLRGLVRRREMMRFLSLPFVFLVTSVIGVSSGGGLGGFQFAGFFIVGLSSVIISMAAIGSEGKAIANLYQYPLSVRDFVVGKGATPAIFGALFAVAFFVITGLISRLGIPEVVMLLVPALLLVFEMTLFGMYIGARFPNFSEFSRSSFMSQSAGLIGVPLSFLLMAISVGPFLFGQLSGSGTSGIFAGFGITLAIIVIAILVLYRMVSIQARKLLSQLPGQD